MCFKINDRVNVSGEVEYGDQWYRVSSKGIIVETYDNTSLVLIDNIDGDYNACVIVRNKYINR